MSETKPTHMLVPLAAFRLFDAIADLALRHGGLEAMQLVRQFTESAKPYTPPVPAALKERFAAAKKKQAAELVAAGPPEAEPEGTGTEG